MPEGPLKIFERLDPQLVKFIESSNDFAFSDGALPRKTKLLIGMCFDASHGTVPGTVSLARQALEAGATRDELTEALRVAVHLSGVGAPYVAGTAPRELFGPDA